ncbi:hypothetical protein [uncultured Paraglaciecola sp.]|nr:hypothetical protein [uncultured Paraglaciecola sp.]
MTQKTEYAVLAEKTLQILPAATQPTSRYSRTSPTASGRRSESETHKSQ